MPMNISIPKTSPTASSISGFFSSNMVSVNWLARELPDPSDQRQYAEERCIVAITETIAEAMERAGLNRTEVAERLGRTKGHISQLLSGKRNMTLRTLADILWACNLEVTGLDLGALGVISVPVSHAEGWSYERPEMAPERAYASLAATFIEPERYLPAPAHWLDVQSQQPQYAGVVHQRSSSPYTATEEQESKTDAENANMALAA